MKDGSLMECVAVRYIPVLVRKKRVNASVPQTSISMGFTNLLKELQYFLYQFVFNQLRVAVVYQMLILLTDGDILVTSTRANSLTTS